MNNPLDKESDSNYVCQDCKYYQNGKCMEEDELGEICIKFELATQKIKEIKNDNK